MAPVLEAPSAGLTGDSPGSSLATLPEGGDWGGDRCLITESGSSASPNPEWTVAAPAAAMRPFQGGGHPAGMGDTKAVSLSLEMHSLISCVCTICVTQHPSCYAALVLTAMPPLSRLSAFHICRHGEYLLHCQCRLLPAGETCGRTCGCLTGWRGRSQCTGGAVQHMRPAAALMSWAGSPELPAGTPSSESN